MAAIETLGIYKKTIGGIPVTLQIKNIAHADVTAYVIPQFPDRRSNGGVAFTFNQAWSTPDDPFDASAAYEVYRKEFRAEVGHSLEYGSIVHQPTINNKALIHAVTALASESKIWDVVQRVVYSSLDLVREHGLGSIAFPCLSTGSEGLLTNEQSARCILNAIHQFGQDGKAQVEPLPSVVIVCWYFEPRKTFLAFKETMQDGSYIDAVPETGQRPHSIRQRIYDQNQQALAAGRTIPIAIIGPDGHAIAGGGGRLVSLRKPDRPLLFPHQDSGSPRTPVEDGPP